MYEYNAAIMTDNTIIISDGKIRFERFIAAIEIPQTAENT